MENRIVHILNRGFEKRRIFFSEKDNLRFVHNLQDFNDRDVTLFSYRNRRLHPRISEMTSPKMEVVDILCWSLLPNHFHIMAQEKLDKGASRFVQKVTIGYTMHLNPRRKRNGTLFQGRSKVIPVSRDAHFLHLPFYILANPLDLFQPHWREKGVEEPKRALEFLEGYRWSSFPDLIGKRNFPEIVNKALFFELFNTNEKSLRKDFMEWLGAYTQSPDLPKSLLP